MGRVIGETLNNGHAKRRTMAMQSFNENWDGIVRKTEQPINEGHYIELDDMAVNVRKTAEKTMKVSDMQSYLKQISGSLQIAHRQKQDFVQGLLFHLEGVHKKVMSPSRHGNMEILNDLSDIIRELKKYQK
jgi:hypothetical protein